MVPLLRYHLKHHLLVNNQKVLLIEDELSLAMVVCDNLKSAGFRITHAPNGEEGLKAFYTIEPDLVILDVMMPKFNGFDVARSIRETNQYTPILFLTAKLQTKDVVQGFESGGNDYIKKPFSIEELLIRIRYLLKDDKLSIKTSKGRHMYELGAFTFNSRSCMLNTRIEERKLTSKESQLLKALCQQKNQTLKKESLLLSIWGDDSYFNSRSLDVYVSRLRKYLKSDPRLTIMNIRGVGYRLIEE